MDFSNKKIEECINYLKKLCQVYGDDCDTCPFGTYSATECYLTAVAPCDWDSKDISWI